jgi:hypothetical protein
MASEVFQLTTSNVSGQTVTLPHNYDLVYGVELLNTGNYPATSAVPPQTFTVVSTAPSTGQVQFTPPNTLTFPTGVTLDTTYGSLNVRGYTRGQIQKVA